MIEKHNDTVRELEHVLVGYLKDGKVGKKRPTIRLGGKKVDAIDHYTYVAIHGYRVYRLLTFRLPHSRKRLQVTEKAVEDYRRQIYDRKPENYGFASMAAVPYAHIVANILKDKKPKGTDVILAPNPKDIVSRSCLPYHSTSP